MTFIDLSSFERLKLLMTSQAGDVSKIHYFIYYRIDKKKSKHDKKLSDSQERAFWDVHRTPVSLTRSVWVFLCLSP